MNEKSVPAQSGAHGQGPDDSRGRRARWAVAAGLVVLPLGLLGSVATASASTPVGAGTVPTATVNPTATVAVDLAADRHAIDPRIYGLNFATPGQLKDLRVTLNRSGGNTTSTYNWRQNADNKGNDWYYESIAYPSAIPGQVHDSFISGTVSGGARPMVTIPMMGRVAKVGDNRGKLASYSVSKYGPQQGTDAQWMPDAGNGVRLNGSLITADPNDASTPSTVADQQAWLQHVVAANGVASSAKPRYYLYDNEPGLWQDTHRDMVAKGVTMATLLARTVAYGTMARATDPGSTLVGPEGWGWLDLRYSGADQQYARSHGWASFPDRAAHGNVDQFPWLLQQLAAREKVTGKRLLDVASVHWYPQGGEFGDDASASMANLRNRSTRALWDPTYTEESWIGEKVALIPRLKEWVRTNYPGTKVGITEYSWGADGAMSGAVAQADVLGIFGRTGLDLANRWTTPATNSPAYQAIRLYRNYDGLGSGFGNISTRAVVANPDQVASFAATRADGTATIMLLNKHVTGTTPVTLTVAGRTAGSADRAQVWQLAGGTTSRRTNAVVTNNRTTLSLPPQSVTLLVLPKAGSASASGTVTPTSAAPGATVGWTTRLTAGATAIAGATIDVGLVSATGSFRVLNTRTGVTLAPGASVTMTGQTPAPAAGTYRLACKVRSSTGASLLVAGGLATLVTKPPPAAVPTVSSSATSGAGATGVPYAFTSSVKVVTAPLSAAIVDIEVYDTNGQKVFQKFYENQSFTAGQTRTYASSWTPTAAGTYTIKIGVFSAGWSGMHHWNNSAGTVGVP